MKMDLRLIFRDVTQRRVLWSVGYNKTISIAYNVVGRRMWWGNFKYCTLFVSGTELLTDKQMDRQTQTDGQTIRLQDAPGDLSGRGHKKLWPMFKFFSKVGQRLWSRSRVQNLWYHWKSPFIKNTNTKYESPISTVNKSPKGHWSLTWVQWALEIALKYTKMT